MGKVLCSVWSTVLSFLMFLLWLVNQLMAEADREDCYIELGTQQALMTPVTLAAPHPPGTPYLHCCSVHHGCHTKCRGERRVRPPLKDPAGRKQTGPPPLGALITGERQETLMRKPVLPE